MSEQTDLSLPALLPYPVKITKLLVASGDDIERTQGLLDYSFKYKLPETGKFETRYGTWESKVDGKVEFWNVDPGDEIEKDYGPVLVVTEPCKHGMQLAGMCTICGKDMTEMDYMSTAPSERAKIKMDHSGEGPLLSAEEAAKLERENTKHLLSQRKLSLIVDLDQTILHATVDPTVGEWLKAKRAAEEGSTTPPPESANFPALDDVVKFQLPDDPMGQGVPHPSSLWYYIKPRPGLIQFMSRLSKLYEMHVYTMGTRSYANAVCAALDPSGAWFGSRILTRSESGSDRFKSLQRLFPSDQSMVVVIDDRADVWGWSRNLVKVIAFDFFVGTGDINSSFLPKQPTIPSNSTPSPPDSVLDELPQAPEGSPVHEAVDPVDEQKEYMNQKVEERPLAKAEEVMEATSPAVKEESAVKDRPKPDSLEHRIRKAVLNDDDRELERVEAILSHVHKEFYKHQEAYTKSRLNPMPHVGVIIPQIRKETFSGVHMVFSGVFPLQKRPEETDEWKTAVSFGAKCSTDINSQVTHLVAAKPGTAKTDKAFEIGSIKVVYVQWFHDSVAKWKRQPEQKYLMERGRRHRSVPPQADQTQVNDRSENRDTSNVLPTVPEEGKVSLPDGATKNGTNATASIAESTNNHDTSTNGHSMDASGFSPVVVEDDGSDAEVTNLQIDWAEVDREVDDALASDDDDDDESSRRGVETDDDSSKMDGVILNTRGVKRRRSGSNTPTTPSKLRFSISANGNENNDEDSPSSKRRKVEDITSIIKGEGDEDAATAEDDDDDFLAREMADGNDDWDDEDDSDDDD